MECEHGGPGRSPSSHWCSRVPHGLQVLETCVKNCGHRFHVLVASQDFVEGVLVRTILPKNNPPASVHDKVLNLIQVSDRWGGWGAQCQLPSLAQSSGPGQGERCCATAALSLLASICCSSGATSPVC